MAAKSKAKDRTKPANRGVNQRLVKALAHPLRVAILTTLNERMASPNELAKELGEGLSQVSYHVKVLKDYKCIELIKTEPRRGAVEHYYRATSRAFLTDRDWKQIPQSVRPGLSADLLQTIVDDVVAALEEGSFDQRDDRHLSWTPLVVDEEGWGELTEALDGALEQVLKIQVASAKRLAKSPENGLTTSVAMMGYEVPASSLKKVPKKKAKAAKKKK